MTTSVQSLPLGGIKPKKHKYKKQLFLARPWLIWGAALIFMLFQFSLQLSGGVMVTQLMHTFNVTTFGASLLTSSYYYIYVLLQTPAGMLADRFGPRRLLTVGGVVCSVGALIFATAKYIGIAEMGDLMMGAGLSCVFVSSLYLIGKWFPPQRYALMVGMAETIGMLGAIFADIFLASVINSIGWRYSILSAAGIALLLSGLCWNMIRDAPKKMIRQAKPFVANDFFKDVRKLLSMPAIWLNGLYAGFMFSIATVFVALWGIPFFALAHHLSITAATAVCTLTFLGIAVGCPVIGWASAYMKNKRPLLILSALMCMVLFSLVIYLPTLPIAVVGLLLILLGFFSSSYVLNYTMGYEIAPASAKSTSVGFINTLAVITAPILQPLVGLLLYLLAHSHSTAGHEVYSVHDYQAALSIIPAGLLLAGLLAYYLPNKHE